MNDRIIGTLIPLVVFILILAISLTALPPADRIKDILSSQLSLLEISRIKIMYKEINSIEDIIPIRCKGAIPVTYTKVVSLADLPLAERKEKFIQMVLPSLLIANYEVKLVRKNLIRLLKKQKAGLMLSQREKTFLEKVLQQCRAKSVESALIKANPVPLSIALAQAALESGWGTSRFFVEGNNLFGMWTFKETSSALPARASEVLLRKYNSLLDSVRSYIYTVNVGWAYKEFRTQRLIDTNPLRLSEFLDMYSVERLGYVKKIKSVIKENNLVHLDSCFLDPAFLQ